MVCDPVEYLPVCYYLRHWHVMQRINNTFALARLVTYPLGMFQSLAFIPNIAALAAAVTFCQTIGGMNVSNISTSIYYIYIIYIVYIYKAMHTYVIIPISPFKVVKSLYLYTIL